MSRASILAAAVFCALLLAMLSLEYRARHPSVPSAHENVGCFQVASDGESGWEQFARQGGHITRYPNARWDGSSYTVADVAQGRHMDKYDKLQIRDPEPRHPWSRPHDPTLAQARQFVWEHWRSHQRGYLVLTLSSVDRTTSSHFFIEPDDSSRWRIYARRVTGGMLLDEPTGYSVKWVIPRGWHEPASPLPSGESPNPDVHQLEFRDICGEPSGHL